MSLDSALDVEKRSDGSLLVKPKNYDSRAARSRVLGITGLGLDNAHSTRLSGPFEELSNYGLVCLGIPCAEIRAEPGKVAVDFCLDIALRRFYNALAELDEYSHGSHDGVSIVGSSASAVIIYEALKSGSPHHIFSSVVLINPYLGGEYATPKVRACWDALLHRGTDLELTTSEDIKLGRRRFLPNSNGRSLFDYDVVKTIESGLTQYPPTLVVAGGEDQLRSADATERLKTALNLRGQSVVLQYPKAPHEINPQDYNSELVAFVLKHALPEHITYKSDHHPQPTEFKQPQ